VFVESIFAWPGVGQLMVQGVQARDYPVMAAATVSAVLVVLGGVIADVLVGVVDLVPGGPMTRHDRGARAGTWVLAILIMAIRRRLSCRLTVRGMSSSPAFSRLWHAMSTEVFTCWAPIDSAATSGDAWSTERGYRSRSAS
jgi:hypothetical protein